MVKSLKIIRYLILGGIFLIPFVPLIVTKSLFFPFITGKNFFLRILIEILLGLWLILVIYDKNYRPRKSWILFFLAALVFVTILSSIFGANFYHSFWSNYERMEGLITFLHLFAYFLILTSILNTEKLWKWFFHISLGVSVIVAIYGLFQLAGKLEIHQGGARLDATLGNASYLAIYMVFHIFLALWYFLKTRNWYRWFYLPVIVLESLILYHTATRGAILGFVGSIILATFLILIFSPLKKIRVFAISSVIIIFALLTSFWFLKSSEVVKNSPVLSRFSSISLQETTTQSRFVIWKMSWEGFKEKPIFGWGPENYNLVFNKYYQPILWKQEPWFDRAHNVFFDRLTTNGIFGLLTYLALFGSAVYYLLLKRKKCGFDVYDSAFLTALFFAYFFHNLFVFDNLVSFLIFFAFLGYTHYRCIVPTEKVIASGKPASDYKKATLASVVVITVLFLIYFLNIPALLAAYNLLGAFKESGQGNFQGTLQKFEKSLAYNSFGSTETREQLINFATQITNHPSLDNSFKSKVFEKASSEMKKQINESPDDIRYMIFLGALLNKEKKYDEAIDIIQKAINLSPNKQQLYFELGGSYLNTKNYNKAEEVLKKAFDLDHAFDDARKIYAVALIFNGKETLAEKLLEEGFSTIVITDERLIRAYLERGRFDRIVPIREKFVEGNLNNAQYRVNLAASYLQIGKREKAIIELQKAIELEPKFKQQGEYLINEIKAGRNP